MGAQEPKVKSYWENAASDFDAIYAGKKNAFWRGLDRILRKAMSVRYEKAIAECRDAEIRSILDVGCGPGRFCLPLAAEKETVVGIDFSSSAIAIARQRAAETNASDRCEFIVGDFLDTPLSRSFDAILAMGLFDYVREPNVFLEKMSGLLSGKLISSWPSAYSWRMPVRWVRLNLKGCPVHFFTPAQIEQLHQQAGLNVERIERIQELYFVVARPQQ